MSQQAGMLGDPPAHEHHTPHHGLHPAPGGPPVPQGPGKYHVFFHHLEHVVDQHPEEQRGIVYGKLPLRKPLHVHLALELGMRLLTDAPLPVYPQAGPKHTDPNFRNQGLLGLLVVHLVHLIHCTDRLFEPGDLSQGSSFGDRYRFPLALQRCCLASPLSGDFQPGLRRVLLQVVSDDKLRTPLVMKRTDQDRAAKAAFSQHQNGDLVDHGIGGIYAPQGELPDSLGGGMGTPWLQFCPHHPATAQVGKGCEKGEVLRLHTARFTELHRALGSLPKEGPFHGQALKRLPEDLRTRNPAQPQGPSVNRVISDELQIIEAALALAQEVTEGPHNLLVGDLRLIGLGNLPAKIANAECPAHLNYHRKPHMAHAARMIQADSVDGNAPQPPFTRTVKPNTVLNSRSNMLTKKKIANYQNAVSKVFKTIFLIYLNKMIGV